MRTNNSSPVLIVIRDGEVAEEPTKNFIDPDTGWWNRMVMPNGIRIVWSNDMDPSRERLLKSISGLAGFTAFITRTDGRVVSVLMDRVDTQSMGVRFWDPENGVDIGESVFQVPMSDIDTIYIP